MKQNWKDIDLGDVVGMASNPVKLGPNYAKRLLNVYPHQKPGALILRPGYSPKYTAPTDSYITGTEYPNFGVFFDRQADQNGREIICQIQKGTLSALLDETDQPVVTTTINGFWFYVRPYWDGVQWLNNWNLVNKTYITKISALDAGYSSHLKIYGNLNHGLNTDTLIGYTVYNQTKNQYARIITCELESPYLWINITLYDNEWEVDDVLIISKYWIDLSVQTELYNNVQRENIQFHRVLNDIRIGFGGKANRPGIAIGYRKKYFLISEVDFTNLHTSITSAAIEKFAKIDGIMLDTNILNKDAYGIDITTAAGSHAAGTYYYRLTGLIDGYGEQLLAENSIQVDGTQDIRIAPYMIMGKLNPRVTKLKLYQSEDGITFYKLREDFLTGDSYSAEIWKIDSQGRIITNQISIGIGEYHNNSNAASVINESNSVGQWTKEESIYGVLSSVASFVTVTSSTTINPAEGSYLLLFIHYLSVAEKMKLISPLITSSEQNLHVSFYAMKSRTGDVSLKVSSKPLYPNPFGGEAADFKDIALTEALTKYEFDLKIDGYLTFDFGTLTGPVQVALDSLSCTSLASNTLSVEMTSEMGYTPTYNLVKGWDKAINLKGRTYYLNPFVEKRYENYLLVSLIRSGSVFMYDIASFANFRELERYDSSRTVTIELLPNNEILVLKDSSVSSIYDDGLVAIPREPVYGVDCISMNSVVNINGLIFFCGKEDVYVLNIGQSIIPQPMLENSIRDIYLSIADKEKIFSARNRYNTYRMRKYNSTSKAEYLLTKNGWIEERKWHFAEVYRPGYSNKLYFSNRGNIYEEAIDFTLPDEEYGGQEAE